MTEDAYLVLHGIENHRPPEHWQYWISDRLRAHGAQVSYPALPDPDSPRFEIWRSALRDHLGELDGRRRTVICHSLACLLWLGAAPDLEAAVDRLLLVSPPAPELVPPAGASFRVSIDAEAVRASVRGVLRIVSSDADPYNPVGADRLYGTALRCALDVIPGAGHITPEDGYGPWPALEAWCVGDSPTVGR